LFRVASAARPVPATTANNGINGLLNREYDSGPDETITR
jgi:hypothetical protein